MRLEPPLSAELLARLRLALALVGTHPPRPLLEAARQLHRQELIHREGAKHAKGASETHSSRTLRLRGDRISAVEMGA